MAVRNFWIEAKVDGRKSDITGGPQGAGGGMSGTIFQRSEGAVTKGVEFEAISRSDDSLLLRTTFPPDAKIHTDLNGNIIVEVTTQR